MASAWKFMAGGLLAGAGEGISEGVASQAKTEKARALEEVKHKYRMEEQAAGNAQATGLLNRRLSFEEQQAEKQRTFTAEQADKARSAKEPALIEYYDEKTGRKRKGYLKSGAIVPVGGVEAATETKGSGTAEIKNYKFATEVLRMSPAEAASWARMKKTTPKSEIRADLYKRFAGNIMYGSDPKKLDEAVDHAMTYLYGDKPKGQAAPEAPKKKSEGIANTALEALKRLIPKREAEAMPENKPTESAMPKPAAKPTDTPIENMTVEQLTNLDATSLSLDELRRANKRFEELTGGTAR